MQNISKHGKMHANACKTSQNTPKCMEMHVKHTQAAPKILDFRTMIRHFSIQCTKLLGAGVLPLLLCFVRGTPCFCCIYKTFVIRPPLLEIQVCANHAGSCIFTMFQHFQFCLRGLIEPPLRNARPEIIKVRWGGPAPHMQNKV